MELCLKCLFFCISRVVLHPFEWLKIDCLQIEPIRNLFAALFLASIGMLINVQFLWNHVDILLAAVILVIIVKTIVISTVVKGFGYNNKTSVLVRLYYYILGIRPKLMVCCNQSSGYWFLMCRLECHWLRLESLLLFFSAVLLIFI